MTDSALHQLVASLLPGMPVETVARQLREAGATGHESGEPWEIRTNRGALGTITFSAGFPGDVPIHGLRIGDSFQAMLRVYPEAGVVVSAKSASGRPFYLIPLPDAGAELLVELGQRNELEKITLMPNGRFREKAPDHWQAMTAFMARRSAQRAEELRRASTRKAQWEQERATAAHIASIADPDQQLDTWAEHTSIWGKPAPWLKPYAAWLRAGSPLRWHDAAQNWNWDYGVVPLRWIATRGDCDSATALAIFFAGEPADAQAMGEEAELLELIRERWVAGRYSTRRIRFELPFHVRQMAADADLEKVPVSMRVAIEGDTAPTIEYADGFPAFLLMSAPSHD